ncbi:hypothetical protein LTR28_002048 [Elasticomyces elasticus]|nr:hypothetical protein LTR28_002048 [Elasticomyces elasticus]
MAFKAKDLHFEKTEPPFLRRLRAEQAGKNLDDRHERATPRPKRLKRDGDSDEDEPTYVVEESNDTLSKAEYEAMAAAGKSTAALSNADPGTSASQSVTSHAEEAAHDAKDDPVPERARVKQHVADAGTGPRKRKAVRVAGGGGGAEEGDGRAGGGPDRKIKKKAKAVKLSFRGDE